jgi:hypothetical protein
MKKLCRFAAVVVVLATALWGATPRLAHAEVYCERLHNQACRTAGATVQCLWNEPAGAVGVCECRQTAQGLRWMCV